MNHMNTMNSIINTFGTVKVVNMARGGELELLRTLQPFHNTLSDVFTTIRGQLHVIKRAAVDSRRFKISCNQFGSTRTTLDGTKPSELSIGEQVSLWRPSQVCYCYDFEGMGIVDRLELLDARFPGIGVEFTQEAMEINGIQCMVEAITFIRARVQLVRCMNTVFMLKCPGEYMSPNRRCPLPYLRDADQITLVHVSQNSIFYERIGSRGMFATLSDAAENVEGYDAYDVEVDTRHIFRLTGYKARAAVINGNKLDSNAPVLRDNSVLSDMLPTNFVGVNYSRFEPIEDRIRVTGSEGMPTVHFCTVAKGMHALATIADSDPIKPYVECCVEALKDHYKFVELAGCLFREYLTRKTVIHNERRFAPGGSEYHKLVATSPAAAVMRKRKLEDM